MGLLRAELRSDTSFGNIDSAERNLAKVTPRGSWSTKSKQVLADEQKT